MSVDKEMGEVGQSKQTFSLKKKFNLILWNAFYIAKTVIVEYFISYEISNYSIFFWICCEAHYAITALYDS